jgi:ABC-type protease/lipase transport system fused ATPase/permease subunit
LAGALFLAGIGLTNVADATWMHVIGAVCYVACVVVGFRVAVPLVESA